MYEAEIKAEGDREREREGKRATEHDYKQFLLEFRLHFNNFSRSLLRPEKMCMCSAFSDECCVSCCDN